jgi:membrane associated rhomboid family serine protease
MFILPVNHDRPPERSAKITIALVILNSVIWLGLTIAGMNRDAVQSYGLHPGHWTLITLFTHMFLHAGFWHVAGNMWFLWMFAPKLEERLGSAWFLLAYLVCGAGAAAVQTIFSPGSMIPMVGASGAISGVAGMYFVLFPRSPFNLELYLGWWHVKSFPAQTRGAVGAWIGEQFVLGLLNSMWQVSGIAFWAHVGGFLSGLLIAAAVALTATPEEQRELIKPAPLTKEELEELTADRREQPSELVSLKLKD